MTAIRLYRGRFGHFSFLNAASDLVTHAHPESHIIMWLDGEPGRIQVGTRSVSLGPDFAVGINSFEPHSHSFPGGEPGLFLALYIEPDWAADRFGLPVGAPIFRHPAVPLAPELRAMALGFFQQLAGGEERFDLTACEMERLIDRLVAASRAGRSSGLHQAARHRHLDFRVRKAIALMRANLAARMSLDELARAVGLSRPHFFSLFKRETRLTPNVYWNTLRMEEALRQLQGSEESLTDLACHLGFTTQGNFTRFFRDHAGVPPTLYREAARVAA
ncbi:AraC family transcriptional regulator [Aquibium oceanicum]|uniref:AraC family transcriptional regulator n=1 Tax=Aquibium oceanicum TaxID=1670800 RepID=A0A1L3SR96_9HYPH|nr:AraC family transcriptional regulator [Aquibium oceanicum]APH71928.1 AraC family transcriptional regulator [Aquibium oceanicum]